jgi:hypothetical protein
MNYKNELSVTDRHQTSRTIETPDSTFGYSDRTAADIDSYLSDTRNETSGALRNRNENSSGNESQYNANFLLYSSQKAKKKIALTLCLHNLRNVYQDITFMSMLYAESVLSTSNNYKDRVLHPG